MNINENHLQNVDLPQDIIPNVINDSFRNSNSTEVIQAVPHQSQPPFTEDSSVSSTYNPHTRSLSLSVASALKTPSSLKTSKSAFMRRQRPFTNGDNLQRRNLYEENEEEKGNVASSQESNSSANEEVVKVTDASTLDVACIVHIEPPQIKDYPQIIRPQSDMNKHCDHTSFIMQLHCDQQKLMNSCLLRRRSEDLKRVNVTPSIKSPINNGKRFTSIEIQTLPVRILPIPDEDDSKLEIVSKYSNKSQLELIHQETQAPVTPIPKIRTYSDKTAHSKERDNTDIQIESSLKTINDDAEERTIPDEFWGDVYNDYKKQLADNIGKINFLTRKDYMKNPKLMPNVKDGRRVGGDVLIKDLSVARKKALNLFTIRPRLKVDVVKNKSVKVKRNIKEDDADLVTDNENYKRFYEVSQFDEMTKSYLSPSDRRVRAICSKIGCKIRMYGPIVRWNTDDARQIHSVSPTKTFYYITVGAFTKERMEKSIKCIQETFPKACLCQKFNVIPISENLGDEIPI